MAKVLSLHNTSDQEPIEQYRQEIKAGVTDPNPYNRLMIHYRKLKKYEEELKVIRQAIATFRKIYAQKTERASKTFNQSKIKSLSKQISQRMGLVDKKGNEIYLPEPLPTWIRRQSIVEEKLKKQPTLKKARTVRKKRK